MIKIVNFIWFLLNCKYFCCISHPRPPHHQVSRGTSDCQGGGGPAWTCRSDTGTPATKLTVRLVAGALTSASTSPAQTPWRSIIKVRSGHLNVLVVMVATVPATTSWWSLSTYSVSKDWLVAGIPNLMVVTIQEPPYVMVKCPECSGNDRYEGFAIDLLNRISQVKTSGR